MIGRTTTALLLLATACSSPTVKTCPGERVTTLAFEAVPELASNGCPFSTSATIEFTATITLDAKGVARLCPDRPEATPLTGTLVDGRLDLASPAASTVSRLPGACECAVQITERLQGQLVGSSSRLSFDGTLMNGVAVAAAPDGSPVDPAACNTKDGGVTVESCGAPCELWWKLTGH